MNSGIRDAHNLGWKLAAVLNGSFGPQLLDTYQIERKPHARALMQLAIATGRVMTPSSRINAWLIQTGFRLASIAPSIQNYFAQMKYKPKPFYAAGFVARHKDSLDIVGRMLPQPEVEFRDRRRTMLDNIIGSGFALMAYGRDAEIAVAALSKHDLGMTPDVTLAILPPHCNPAPETGSPSLVLRDISGALAPVMRGEATTMLMLRPDRYVMAAGLADATGLANFIVECRSLAASCQAGVSRPKAAYAIAAADRKR